MRNLRVAVIGGALSYRALFDWVSPALFVSAMLATPVFQVLFFADLGPAYSRQPAEFFAVGNAVQACAMAGVVGVSQTIANERLFGTMGQVVLTLEHLAPDRDHGRQHGRVGRRRWHPLLSTLHDVNPMAALTLESVELRQRFYR